MPELITEHSITSPYTSLAIEAFRAVERAERTARRRSAELERWLTQVPAEDLSAYVEITEDIRRQYEEEA